MAMMRLVACIPQWRQEADDFGCATWADGVVIPEVVPGESLSPLVNRVRSGEGHVEIFSGIITNVDIMPDRVVYVTVATEDGAEGEFEGLGGSENYRLGRPMTVRQFVFPRGERRFSTYPAEIWVGDSCGDGARPGRAGWLRRAVR
jgi:hypothetical protein